MSMLLRHPRSKLLAGYQDSHIYVCQRVILDILCIKSRCLSFREEFLPWLCRMQYQPIKKQKYAQGICTFRLGWATG
jgi:translation initiation factor eIF-2B subunit gamma